MPEVQSCTDNTRASSEPSVEKRWAIFKRAYGRMSRPRLRHRQAAAYPCRLTSVPLIIGCTPATHAMDFSLDLRGGLLYLNLIVTYCPRHLCCSARISEQRSHAR